MEGKRHEEQEHDEELQAEECLDGTGRSLQDAHRHELTIEEQLEACREWAKENGYTITATYTESLV